MFPTEMSRMILQRDRLSLVVPCFPPVAPSRVDEEGNLPVSRPYSSPTSSFSTFLPVTCPNSSFTSTFPAPILTASPQGMRQVFFCNCGLSAVYRATAHAVAVYRPSPCKLPSPVNGKRRFRLPHVRPRDLASGSAGDRPGSGAVPVAPSGAGPRAAWPAKSPTSDSGRARPDSART